MLRPWLVEHLPRPWTLWAASRPSQLALVVVLYMLGVGVTTTGSPFVAGDPTATTLDGVVALPFLTRVLAGAVALLPVAVAIHYANEYADVDTDALTDRTPFSGGSGALVTTGLGPSFLRTALVVVCLIATGVILAGVAGGLLSPLAVGILVVSFVVGVAYSLPPIALVRRGVGEPVNMLLGGLLLPVYGAAVVATPTLLTVLAVIPFTLIVGCNLLAVHWPDRKADATVGKRTSAVRWRPARIRRAYAVLAGSATIVTVGLWWTNLLPDIVALAHVAPVPFLIWGWQTLTRQRSPLPAVTAMVALAVASTVAWWLVGLA